MKAKKAARKPVKRPVARKVVKVKPIKKVVKAKKPIVKQKVVKASGGRAKIVRSKPVSVRIRTAEGLKRLMKKASVKKTRK